MLENVLIIVITVVSLWIIIDAFSNKKENKHG